MEEQAERPTLGRNGKTPHLGRRTFHNMDTGYFNALQNNRSYSTIQNRTERAIIQYSRVLRAA